MASKLWMTRLRAALLVGVFHLSGISSGVGSDKLIAAEAAITTEKSLFEVGFGALYSHLPDYPGAAHARNLSLPFPLVVYRGLSLRSDKEEGLRARLINTPYVEFDLSYDGTFSSDTSHNPARQGMPNLDSVGEVGPNLVFHAPRSNNWLLSFNLALRKAISSDFHTLTSRGSSVNPFLALRVYHLFTAGSLLLCRLGAKYASTALMDYYYKVDQQYETSWRPSYQGRPGLMAYTFTLNTHLPVFADTALFTSYIHSFMHTAANRASPLLKHRHNTLFAVGFIHTLYRSPEKGFE